MKYKKSVILLILFFFLFCVSSAYASDADDSTMAGDEAGIELTTIESNVKTIEEKQTINGTNNDETLSAGDGEVLTAENDLDVLGDDESTFSYLEIELRSSDYYITLEHKYYRFDYHGKNIEINHHCVIDGNGAVIDMAGSSIRPFYVGATGVTFKNLSIINTDAINYPGTIYFSHEGTVENCNFSNNWVRYGGGVYFAEDGHVINCNFINNSVYFDYGGAIYFGGSGTVVNSNFVDNYAEDGGGAIYFDINSKSSVENCNFVNNIAEEVGNAIFFNSYTTGTIKNCNFTNSKLPSINNYGGAVTFAYGSVGTVVNCNFVNLTAENDAAIWFEGKGIVRNCNFVNNTVSKNAGAIDFSAEGTVENCNFVNNTAVNDGAICFEGNGIVRNCNFVNNAVSNSAGAINFKAEGTVENCNFTNNAASNGNGGAIWISSGNVTNCNFVNNTASKNNGGAIFFDDAANVKNCKFTENNAANGSAIYFSSTNTKNVSHSIFLNNRANADSLQVTQIYDEIEITFKGNDNLLNAIYCEKGDVSFTNVTYWGSNGITNTGRSTVTPSRSNNESGQNIAVTVVVNDILILNSTEVTDDNGKIVLDLVAGNYTIAVSHDSDSYYTQAEKTQTFVTEGNESSLEFYVFELIATATVSPNTVEGYVFFTAENESGMVKSIKTPLSNGVAHFDLFGLDLGEYNITATYLGNSDYGPSKSNMTCEIKNTYSLLSREIGDGGNIKLKYDYYTYDYGDTINIASHHSVIDGNGAVIDMAGPYIHAFRVTGYNVTIKNLTIKNSIAHNLEGAAIYWEGENGNLYDCAFVSNSAKSGGALYWDANKGNVYDCVFLNNSAYQEGGAITFHSNDVVISGCVFENCSSYYDNGGAIIGVSDQGVISDCVFVNNHAGKIGGALRIKGYYFVISGCSFLNNSAVDDAGAILLRSDYNNVSGCYFADNSASRGILTLFDGDYFTVNDNIFLNNDGTAIYFDDAGSTLNIDYNWFGNDATNYGDAPSVENCTVWLFLNGTANPNELVISHTSDIMFKLYAYDSNVVSEYDNGRLKDFNLTITPTNGNVNATKTNLGKSVLYTAENDGFAKITAAIEDIAYSIPLTVTDGTTFFDLNKTINGNSDSVIVLENDYAFDYTFDHMLSEGIVIDRPLTIIGNNHIIDAAEFARIFQINADNVEIRNITFINTRIFHGMEYTAGAIIWDGAKGIVSDCVFANNSVGNGAALYWEGDDAVISGCSFVNNSADDRAGAIYLKGNGGLVSGCSFVNNSAAKGGAVYVWANDTVVSGSVFVNNTCTNGIIYFDDNEYSNLTVNDNIFLNNDGVAILFRKFDSASNADYNWFGNDATNYNDDPNIQGCNVWLFLNGTANPEIIPISEASDIMFKLYAYDLNDVSEYDNNRLKEVNLTLIPTKGNVNTTKVNPGKSVRYTPENLGFAEVTATIENAAYTIKLRNSDGTTFSDLNRDINGNDNDIIVLDKDYTFNSTFDRNLCDGVVIDRAVTIIGNNHIIDAAGQAMIFYVKAANVTIKNITFINTGITRDRESFNGAVYWYGADGILSDCVFANNSAGSSGAICWYGDDGIVSDCVFENNTVDFDDGPSYWSRDGGAVNWIGDGGLVSGCVFVNNSAWYGGAVYWYGANGTVSGSVFVNNSASRNGIVYFDNEYYGNLTINDNIFLNNNATAISFYQYDSASKADYNWFGHNATNYMNNLNVESCSIWLFLDATSSPDVTYISDTADITFRLYAYRFEGISEYDNSRLRKVTLTLTPTNGKVNTSETNLEKPVRFTVEDSGAKLTAAIENVVFTFPLAIRDGTTFWDLNRTINGNNNDTINLDKNYTFNPLTDDDFKDGVVIGRPITIIGNNYVLNGAEQARIFNVASDEVTIRNVTFINGSSGGGNGGAIYWNGANGIVSDCSFVNNSVKSPMSNGGAIYWTESANGLVSGCSFVNNFAYYKGGAIMWNCSSGGVVSGCVFDDNHAYDYGGAVYWYGANGVVSASSFSNNNVYGEGGAICWEGDNGNVLGCEFVNNKAYYNGGGAIGWSGDDGIVSDCSFVRNSAVNSGDGGGAIRWEGARGNVSGCDFVDNSAIYYGAAIEWSGDDGVVSGCYFAHNINDDGIIYFNNKNNVQHLSVNDNIFLNNQGIAVAFEKYDSTSNVDYNWFGHNATNYMDNPNVETCNVWLFLNATANPEIIPISGTTDVTFKLYAYNLTDVSEYDMSHLKAVNLTLTPTNGKVNTADVSIGKPVKFTAEDVGGKITAAIENVVFTFPLVITDGTTFLDLNNTINGNENETIVLDRDYAYNPITDSAFKDGIVINRALTIVGNDHSISGTKQARIFNIQADNVTIKDIAFINAKTSTMGGAISWDGANGTASGCSFMNNSASNGGGAIVWAGSDGAVYDCVFVNNSAGRVLGNGGAILWIGSDGAVYDCVFENNYADDNGGAIVWTRCDNGAIYNCRFVNNHANIDGGAVYWAGSDNGFVYGCSFVKNTAHHGAAIGWDGCSNGNISGCVFVENYDGLAVIYFYNLYSGNNLTINDNIFLNDLYAIEYSVVDNTSNADYNWFGHNSTNYQQIPRTFKVGMNNWLFLNATADPYTICLLESSDVLFKLYLYDGSGGISDYDNGRLQPVNLTVTAVNGDVEGDAKLGEILTYTATAIGNGSVTAKIENAEFTIPINVIKSNPNLSVVSEEFDYTNNTVITINYDPAATGKVNIEFRSLRSYYFFRNRDLNATISLGSIDAAQYDVIVEYSGDDIFTNATAIAIITVKKVDSTLTVNDIEFDYGGEGSTEVSFTGATGVEAKVIGHGEAVVEVRRNTITVSNLNAGEYTLAVTTIPDKNHNAVTENVAITVGKLNSTVDVNDTTFDYGGYAIIAAVTEGATGITAEIDGEDADVIGNAILIFELGAGNHTLTVTTVPDANHNPATATASVTVNKVSSTITVTDIVVYYGEYVNVDVTTDGATSITAKIDDEDAEVHGNIITIPNDLESGNHMLTVTTVPDNNHTAATKTVNIVDCRVDDNVIVIIDGKAYPAKIVDGKVIIDTGIGKQNTTISLDVSSVENEATFTVNVNPDAAGIVRFEVSGAEEYTVYVDVLNGVAVLENVLEEGDYTVVATYMGDGRFNTNITSESFTVKGHVKKDTPISANANVNGNKVTITVNVDENATGFVSLKQSESTIYIAVENGVATYTNAFAPGSYNVEVTYIGDANYNEISTQILFTVVEAAKENTTIGLDVRTVENNATFTVDVNPNATGIVKFEFAGHEEYMVYKDIEDGQAVLIGPMDAGNYILTVTYMGDDRFNTNSTSQTFTVIGHVKKDTPITANADVNGYRVTLTVNVDENATGFVNMKFGEAVFNVELTEGAGSFTINLPANSYSIEVTYPGDYNFNDNGTTLSFTVEDPVKESTPIALDVSGFEENVTFTVTVNENASGIVKFAVSGAENYTVYADVINGVAIMGDVLTPGDYTVVATYMGDDMFNSNITSQGFTVRGHVKKDTPISAEAKVNGNRVTITVNVDENATGFVGLKQSGSTSYIAVENGMATYVTALPAGSYNVEVTYLGDDDYNENSTRLLFTVVEVAKKTTPIELNVSSVEDYATFTVNVNADATGIVRFEVSGAERYTVYADVINGVAVMEDVLTPGDYAVVATYVGDDMYNPNSTVGYFTVSGHVLLNVTINCDVAVDGNEVAVTAVLNESSATGFVEFNIAGKKYYVPVENGQAVFVADFLSGTYMGNVQYLGDDDFNPAMTLVYFTVVEQNVTLKNTTLDVIVSSHENDVSIVAVVNSSATGLVEVVLGDSVVYLPIDNGAAGYEVMLPGGDYTVAVTYLGDDKFNPNSTTRSFVVYDHIKGNTTISAEVAVNANTVTVTANVDSRATGFVEFNIAGKKYYAPVNDRKAVMVADFLAGTYMGNVQYLGDDDFNPAMTLVYFTVIEQNVTLENTSIEIVVGAMENDVSIIARVNESATGLVEFVIDGKAVYIAVNNGEAVYDVVLAGGNYNVTATYMGDSRFNPNSTAKEFTVTDHVKLDTRIKCNISIDEFEVTLTAIVNESAATGFAEFNIAGKKYYAPVEDGKAVFTADFIPGTYSGNIKYLGDENFKTSAILVSFNVLEKNVTLENTTIDVIVSSEENDVSIVAVVNSSATGLVEFVIGDNVVYLPVTNGEAGYEVMLLGGQYNVTVTYLGDAKFNSNSTTKAFVVYDHIKSNTTVTVDAFVNANTVTLTANVDSRATGFVEFNIAGKKYYAPVNDGKAVMVADFLAGTYMGNVQYLGDDEFNPAATLVYFTVIEQNVTLENTSLEVVVGAMENDVSIIARVNESATGLVEFVVDGKAVYVAVNNGEAVYDVVLAGGEYTVGVTYMGDSRFNPNSTAKQFTVTDHVKLNTRLKCDIAIDEFEVTLTAIVNESDATGFVEFNIAGKKYYAPVEDGKAVFSADFIPGTYSGNIKYLGDENFKSSIILMSFTVLEKNVTLDNTTLDVIVSSEENDVSIVAVVNSSATGLVEVVIGDTVVYLPVNNGAAGYKLMLPGGEYNVSVTYLGDGKFNPNSTTKSFVVYDHIKENTTINCDVVVDDYAVTVTANVDSRATGFVEFNIAGKKYYAPVNEGKAVLSSDFLAGNYMGNAQYLGDENFNPATTLVFFTVIEQNVTLENTTVDVIVSSEENDVSIVVMVNESATGLVEVIIGDTVVYLPIDNGVAGYEVMLPGGEYNVTATYLGDAKFNPNSTTEAFVVYDHIKVNTTINCDVVVDDYTVTVTANVDPRATGFVEFNIAGKKYYAPVNDGKAVLSSDFLAGTYSGNAFYMGDDDFNGALTLVFFTVIEQNVTLENTTVDVIVSSVENDVSIVVMVNESATGLVEVIIGDTVVYLPIDNGAVGYELILPGGEYNVTATYLGDGKFNPNSTTKAFVVYDHIKKNTTITSDVSVDGYMVTVTVNVDSKATGFVEFILNGNSIFAEVNGGKAVISNIVAPGKYTIPATYMGDDDFNANSTEIEVTVEEIPLKNTTIDAKVDIFENNITITVNVDENATGFVEFYVTGAEEYTVYVVLSDGKAILDDVLTAGDYTVLITYLGDFNFNMNSTTQNFTVFGHIKNDTSIKAISDVEGNTVTIDVDVNKDATGFVTIEVMGQTFIVPVNDGKAVFTYDFNPGIYDANVVYLGDEDFNNASTTVSFTVIQQVVVLKNTTIDVSVDALENDVAITANINALATGLIEFNIDGKSVYLAVNNGKAVYSVNLPAGEYDVLVTYLGDSKFNPNSTSKKFVVVDHIKQNTTISAEVTVDGNVATIAVNVNAGATGFVEFNIGDEDVYIAIKDGKAAYSIVLPNGDYTASITYVGDKDFNGNSTVKEFSISNIAPKVTEFTNIAIGEDYAITARLVDVDGNPVKDAVIKYVMGNVSGSTKTDADGVFTIDAQSDCVVFMEFEGNSTFRASNISIKIDTLENEKLASQFNVTEGISIKTYAVDLKAGEIGCVEYFKLTDSNGNPIVNASIKFAYKAVILNRTTDENGIVYLGINTYVAQTALCAMSYLGDETHNATFVAFSFDIQLKPISITAKAKTFKKSTKTKKYTVTLKTQKCNSRDGKVYLSSGKKVTLKVNGKTYTAKTNSKGQATFKITKLTKKGKFNAVVKFAGDKTYKSASKKVKITVK